VPQRQRAPKPERAKEVTMDKKLRRQVEELLRKGSSRQLGRVAALLGVACNPETHTHYYSEYECPNCGAIFCYACCGGQNVDVGNRYGAKEYMNCPVCGTNVLA